MHADIQGSLDRINKSYRMFQHRGRNMSKIQVKTVLEYALKKGYDSTRQLSDKEVDEILTKTS